MRVIWKSTRYALEFNACLFLVNLHVKLTSTLQFESVCSLSLANSALEIGVSIFHVNKMVFPPGIISVILFRQVHGQFLLPSNL